MRKDKSKYEHLWNEPRINMSQGDDRYPRDISSARNVLYNYSMLNNNNNTNDTQVILSQVNSDDSENRGNNSQIPGTDSKCYPIVTCYKCNKKGHIIPMSPSSDSVQFFAATITSLDDNIIQRSWILLDTCSSINFNV